MITKRNTNSINWKALKLTIADNQIHQLGRTIYRHVAKVKGAAEHIDADLGGKLWICWLRKWKGQPRWDKPVFVTSQLAAN